MIRSISEFESKLTTLINECSMEGESNTPDFILAEFLDDILTAFARVTKKRDEWYHESHKGICETKGGKQ